MDDEVDEGEGSAGVTADDSRRRATSREEPAGPRVEDPDWSGIAIERQGSEVHVRYRARGHERHVRLTVDDTVRLADLLEEVVAIGPP